MPIVLIKRVDAADLILALDELETIIKAQCPTPEKRHEMISYVIFRGLAAIREEWGKAQVRSRESLVS